MNRDREAYYLMLFDVIRKEEDKKRINLWISQPLVRSSRTIIVATLFGAGLLGY